MPVGSTGGILSQNPWNAMQAQPPLSFYGIQPTMPQQAQNPYAGLGKSFCWKYGYNKDDADDQGCH
jgi:hypothetical protein